MLATMAVPQWQQAFASAIRQALRLQAATWRAANSCGDVRHSVSSAASPSDGASCMGWSPRVIDLGGTSGILPLLALRHTSAAVVTCAGSRSERVERLLRSNGMAGRARVVLSNCTAAVASGAAAVIGKLQRTAQVSPASLRLRPTDVLVAGMPQLVGDGSLSSLLEAARGGSTGDGQQPIAVPSSMAYMAVLVSSPFLSQHVERVGSYRGESRAGKSRRRKRGVRGIRGGGGGRSSPAAECSLWACPTHLRVALSWGWG